MTKEQIAKHGEVIKWFCDNSDKGVWCKGISDKEWHENMSPCFSTKLLYVQNDEYAELRKAQADGKVIEQKISASCHTTWEILEHSIPSIFQTHIKYRIKPEESKFKVGDWIVNRHGAIREAVVGSHEDNRSKLWKPTEGDWCIFWDKCDNDYVIRIFLKTNGEYFVDKQAKYSWNRIAPLEFAMTLKETI